MYGLIFDMDGVLADVSVSYRRAILETAESFGETFTAADVAMLVGQEVIGTITLQDWPQNRYDEGDVRLLSTLAASMGVALENARLFEETNRLLAETQQRASELAIINSVGQGLAEQLADAAEPAMAVIVRLAGLEPLRH